MNLFCFVFGHAWRISPMGPWPPWLLTESAGYCKRCGCELHRGTLP